MSLRRAEQDLHLFQLITASFSGRYFRSGCSLFSPDFQYFALPIHGRKTSRESLEAPMEMKDLVYCRFASTGSIFHHVRAYPPKMCKHTSTVTSCQSHGGPSENIIFWFHWLYLVLVSIYSRLGLEFAPISRPSLRVVFVAVYYKNIWHSKNFPFVCIILPFQRPCTYLETAFSRAF